MSTEQTADEQITATVTAWPGVVSGFGPRGEFGFRVGRREIGHLHGDRVAHFGFPRATWARLMADGIVEAHPIDKPGWAARRITGPQDVAVIVTLMRLNYDRVVDRHGIPEPA